MEATKELTCNSIFMLTLVCSANPIGFSAMSLHLELIISMHAVLPNMPRIISKHSTPDVARTWCQVWATILCLNPIHQCVISPLRTESAKGRRPRKMDLGPRKTINQSLWPADVKWSFVFIGHFKDYCVLCIYLHVQSPNSIGCYLTAVLHPKNYVYSIHYCIPTIAAI